MPKPCNFPTMASHAGRSEMVACRPSICSMTNPMTGYLLSNNLRTLGRCGGHQSTNMPEFRQCSSQSPGGILRIWRFLGSQTLGKIPRRRLYSASLRYSRRGNQTNLGATRDWLREGFPWTSIWSGGNDYPLFVRCGHSSYCLWKTAAAFLRGLERSIDHQYRKFQDR